MEEAWKTLVAAGVPDGAPRPAPTRLDFVAIRAALSALDVVRLDEVQRVTLLAWLAGWKSHWPSRFASEVGSSGDALLTSLQSHPIDENRYLKLSRIAVENLSSCI